MDQIIKGQWVEALRSGEYIQGKWALRKIAPDGTVTWCCLGVLCDLAVKAGVIPEPVIDHERDDEAKNYYRYGEERSSTVLPDEVIRWSGISGSNPGINFSSMPKNILKKDGTVPGTLAEANDYGNSFETIATIIDINF